MLEWGTEKDVLICRGQISALCIGRGLATYYLSNKHACSWKPMLSQSTPAPKLLIKGNIYQYLKPVSFNILNYFLKQTVVEQLCITRNILKTLQRIASSKYPDFLINTFH